MSKWQLTDSLIEHIKSITGTDLIEDITTDMVVADSSKKNHFKE